MSTPTLAQAVQCHKLTNGLQGRQNREVGSDDPASPSQFYCPILRFNQRLLPPVFIQRGPQKKILSFLWGFPPIFNLNGSRQGNHTGCSTEPWSHDTRNHQMSAPAPGTGTRKWNTAVTSPPQNNLNLYRRWYYKTPCQLSSCVTSLHSFSNEEQRPALPVVPLKSGFRVERAPSRPTESTPLKPAYGRRPQPALCRWRV